MLRWILLLLASRRLLLLLLMLLLSGGLLHVSWIPWIMGRGWLLLLLPRIMVVARLLRRVRLSIGGVLRCGRPLTWRRWWRRLIWLMVGSR